jgi:hypothetical protein
VGSTPTRVTCVGWALASPSGCNPPAEAVQVQLLPDALPARSSFGEDAGLSIRLEGFDSPTGCCDGNVTSLVYRKGYLPFKQGERVQLPREVISGCRLEWFQRGLISPMAEAYVGSIPTSPTAEWRMENEELRMKINRSAFILNSPFSILHSRGSRGPVATTAGSHPVNDGSSPSGITNGR